MQPFSAIILPLTQSQICSYCLHNLFEHSRNQLAQSRCHFAQPRNHFLSYHVILFIHHFRHKGSQIDESRHNHFSQSQKLFRNHTTFDSITNKFLFFTQLRNFFAQSRNYFKRNHATFLPHHAPNLLNHALQSGWHFSQPFCTQSRTLIFHHFRHKGSPIDEEEEWTHANVDDEEAEVETVEDVIKEVEYDEEDPGEDFFDRYPTCDYEDDLEELKEEEYDKTRDHLTKRLEKHNENVQLMRKSNFMLKAKIDRLYDLLQMQKEKHHDLRLELTRMLADIQ